MRGDAAAVLDDPEDVVAPVLAATHVEDRFLAAPGLAPAATVLQLGLRTAHLTRGRGNVTGLVWERLASFAPERPAETFAVAEVLIERQLRAGTLHLPAATVAAVLRAALAHDEERRRRGRRLIDRLGARDHFGFRALLRER